MAEDLYAKIASEFGITRNEVKHIAFTGFYSLAARSNPKSIEEHIREMVRLALNLALEK